MSSQKPRDFVPGQLESLKFAHRREDYYRGLETIKSLGYSTEDFLHHFPAFVGQMTLGRFLCLYEAYKATLGLAGHIAEVGVFRGAATLFFAKLTELFEPNSLTGSRATNPRRPKKALFLVAMRNRSRDLRR